MDGVRVPHVKDAIFTTCRNGFITSMDVSFCEMTGWSEIEVTGKPCLDVLGPELDSVNLDLIQCSLLHQTIFYGEMHSYRKDGTSFWCALSLSPVRNAANRVTHFVGIMRDILGIATSTQPHNNTKNNLLEYSALGIQLQNPTIHLSFYDSLTGLANRNLFCDRLTQTILLGSQTGHYAAVLFIDMDQFENINKLHGHLAGDALLIQVAHKLKEVVPEFDTVARYGGDEFVILLNELSADKSESYAQAMLIAEKIGFMLTEKFSLKIKHGGVADQALDYVTSSSIGLILFQGENNNQDEVLQNAYGACYEAQKHGLGNIYTHDAAPV